MTTAGGPSGGSGWVPGGPTPPPPYGQQPYGGQPPPPAGQQPYGPQPVTTCYRHPGREAYIRCTRCDKTICPDCMRPASVGFQCPDCVREGNRSVRTAQGRLGGALTTDAVVTKALIALNVIVFLAVGLRYPQALVGSVITPVHEHFAQINTAGQFSDGTVVRGIAGGEYYRMLTAMFLHFGIVHVGLNMYALWIIGNQLEKVLGRWRFLALYLLSGLGGSLLVYLLPGNAVSAGASGAIFGLFGAYFVVLRKLGLQSGGIVGLIAINLVFSFVVPGISWTDHIGGLVVGLVVSAILAYAPRAHRSAIQWSGMALVLALIVVGTVVRTGMLTG